jgi:hypothetical protein
MYNYSSLKKQKQLLLLVLVFIWVIIQLPPKLPSFLTYPQLHFLISVAFLSPPRAVLVCLASPTLDESSGHQEIPDPRDFGAQEAQPPSPQP